jgi:hypothetical protein
MERTPDRRGRHANNAKSLPRHACLAMPICSGSEEHATDGRIVRRAGKGSGGWASCLPDVGQWFDETGGLPAPSPNKQTLNWQGPRANIAKTRIGHDIVKHRSYEEGGAGQEGPSQARFGTSDPKPQQPSPD